MTRVINFSGGRTSAYMTIMEYMPGDIVLFCDTGREHPLTYKFINDFERHEGIPIRWLAYTGGFEAMLEKMKGIPNTFKRNCTRELKVRTARRHLFSLGITKYYSLIGFRSDEPLRVKRHVERWKTVTTLFPLYAQHITKQMILDYWKTKPYDLEIPSILGNCDLCFMKGKNAIMSILSQYPELADKWIADEERSKERQEGAKKIGYTYFEGTTIKQLRSLAQHSLFSTSNLENINPAFDCACTS